MITTKTVFIEELSVRTLLLIVLLWLWNWLKEGRSLLQVYYFRASGFGAACGRYLRRFVPMKVLEADYSWVDIRNPDDEVSYFRVVTLDALLLWRNIRVREIEGNQFLVRLSRVFDYERMLTYISKSVDQEIRSALFQINVVDWFQRLGRIRDTDSPVYYARRLRWSKYIEEYAADRGIGMRWYRSRAPWLKTCLGYGRLLFNAATHCQETAGASEKSEAGTKGVGCTFSGSKNDKIGCFAEVVVPYTGRELVFDPMKHSDVFWLPYNVYATHGVLIYSPRRNGRMPFRRVSMKQLAPDFDAKDVWSPWSDWRTLRLWCRLQLWLIGQWLVSLARHPRHASWLVNTLSAFVLKYAYWYGFFRKFGVRLHVSHGDWYTERVAADQALADLGGLSVSYQKSYEVFPSTYRASAVDVHFAFALSGVDSEVRSCSKISQFVIAGYIHDHAFDHARFSATQLRTKLQHSGAAFIICFFDEDSVDDKRTNMSHEHAGENYRYVLTKVLVDPTLGLIVKPKKPATLRRRLGHLSALLDKVLATGRCFLFDEGGQRASSVLPCEACQAADLAIGLLLGGTAAMESALAGTPTLLIDRERLPNHPLYKLGEGRVVFHDWDSLWKALSAYRRDPGSVAGFGNWSVMLDELDSFRDGRAAERMGTYIGWLAEGLGKGLSREETMELARQRYVGLWGNDKVIRLKDSYDR